jgi:hypothetical protein
MSFPDSELAVWDFADDAFDRIWFDGGLAERRLLPAGNVRLFAQARREANNSVKPEIVREPTLKR